jgi:hypothetical protein
MHANYGVNLICSAQQLWTFGAFGQQMSDGRLPLEIQEMPFAGPTGVTNRLDARNLEFWSTE